MRHAHVVGWILLLSACHGPARPNGYLGLDAGDGAQPDTGVAPDMTSTAPGCEGQTPYRSGPDGGRELLASCAGERPFCAPRTGDCLACLPGSARCDPERGEVPQRCAEDGSRWVDQPACAGSEGLRCSAGRCGDPCALADGERQYLGCDYWASATPNTQLYSGFPFAVALANPHAYAVTVRISGGALGEPRTEELRPGEARAVELPWVDALVQFSRSFQGCTCTDVNCQPQETARSAVVRGGAYRIHATAPVAAYQFNPLTFEGRSPAGQCLDSYTNDASLLLSAAALTRRYVALTVPRHGSAGGFLAVVATAAGATSLTVRLPRNHGVAGAPSGTVRHAGLQAGDVVVIAQSDWGDLSGAVVEATAPVAAFAGHDCAYVPTTRVACDHLEEQLLPLETLGREYVVADLRDRDLGSLVRMVAPFSDTIVTFEPTRIAQAQRLGAGQVFDAPARESFRIRSSRPLLVMQFMYGAGESSPDGGDPSMVQEVPVEQFRDRYDLFVPDTFTASFLGVVAPHGASVLLDGAPLAATLEPLGAWDVLHARVAPGRHELRTREGVPLGVKVYGTGTGASYMYPGGLDLRLLAPE
jgi:hypothetical protein